MTTTFRDLVAHFNDLQPSESAAPTPRTAGIKPEQLRGLRVGQAPPLQEGEVAVTTRARMPEYVAAWWTSMTATERGAIIRAAHRSLSESDVR